MKREPISQALAFYTHANKLTGYKAGNTSKVIQKSICFSPKSELYAILMVLLNFNASLNIITASQYDEGVVLHIESAELISDN